MLYFVLLIPALSFAQPGQRYEQGRRMEHESSTLSVFSENGEQFFLVLNGINQNNVPQSKIRVEGLPEYGNDVQIVFADNRTPAIRKTINIADPVDGREVNMTLKIVRDREGYAKLKFQKCSEVDHNYHPPHDEYVMNYGKPQQTNTVTETSYTDPNTGQIVTQTTTTTTTGNGYNQYNNAPPPPPAPPAPMAMGPQSFNDAKQSISSASFEDTKLSTAKTIFGSNYVNTAQVMEICRLFSFEDSKLAFAKFAYSRTVDQNNYYRVGSVFDFDSNKQALNQFISNGGK
jgi:hypothetical protein